MVAKTYIVAWTGGIDPPSFSPHSTREDADATFETLQWAVKKMRRLGVEKGPDFISLLELGQGKVVTVRSFGYEPKKPYPPA